MDAWSCGLDRSACRVVPHVVHITAPSVAFAVLTDHGFGQIVVDLQPGQRETLDVNGHTVTVIRDYVN